MANRWDNYGGTLHNTDGINDINAIRNVINQRVETLDFGSNGGLLASNYSIVGMDATKIGAAIQAIDAYVERIESKIRQLNENADMNVALKSEVIQVAVKNYIEKVEEYCVNLCSQLRLFRDRLEAANAAWQAHTEALSQAINTDTSSINTGTYRQ